MPVLRKTFSTDRYGMQFAVLNRVFASAKVRKLYRWLVPDRPVINTKLRPVFVVGCGHSGTSILTKILDSHSNLHALAGESYAFRPWFSRDRVEAYLSEKIATELPEGKRLLEKTPRHVHEAERITNLYPQAQIILIARDGRDVVASIKKRTGLTKKAMRRFRVDNMAVLGLRDKTYVHSITYEGLVSQSEKTVRGILEFLNEDYEPVHELFVDNKSDWYGGTSAHSQLRAKQVNTPLFNGSGRWRSELAPAELTTFAKQCGEVQRALGYEVLDT